MRRFVCSVIVAGLLAGSVAADPARRVGIVQDADLVWVSKTLPPDLNNLWAETAWGGLSSAERAEASALQEKILGRIGLSEEDLESFVFSMDLSGLVPENIEVETFLKHVQLASAIGLRKAVTLEQIEQAAEVLKEEGGDAGGAMTRVQVGGQEVLRFSPAPGESWFGLQPVFIGVSPDGKTLALTLNEPSLLAALARAAGGPAAAPSDGMADILGRLEDQHMVLALVIPAGLREKIMLWVETMDAKRMGDEDSVGVNQDAMVAMYIAQSIAPYVSLKSLVLSGHFSEHLDLRLALDMGRDAVAQRAAAVFSQLELVKAEKVTVHTESSVMTLRGRFTPEDLEQIQTVDFSIPLSTQE